MKALIELSKKSYNPVEVEALTMSLKKTAQDVPRSSQSYRIRRLSCLSESMTVS